MVNNEYSSSPLAQHRGPLPMRVTVGRKIVRGSESSAFPCNPRSACRLKGPHQRETILSMIVNNHKAYMASYFRTHDPD